MTLLNKNLSIISGQDVQSICQSLFSTTKISYFHYGKIYDDGSFIVLVTHIDWHKYFMDQDFHAHSQHLLNPGLYLTTALKNYSQEVKDARNYFNIDHKFEMITRHHHYYEAAGFATTPYNDNIVDFYFNHLDLLKNFILCFKEQAYPLIKQSDQEHKFQIANFDKLQTIRNFQKINRDTLNHLKRFYIDDKTYLNKREMECLTFLCRNRSAKEIANILNISSKTVEVYISNIKLKLNCYSKSALFDQALALGLIPI